MQREKDYKMNEENKQSPSEFLDNSNCRKKSNIDPNFDHCRYMLDSDMRICYISSIERGSKDVLCTINTDKSRSHISVSAEKVVTDTASKSVLEVNYCGKQWFMQSFQDELIHSILKKILKLKGII